MNNSHLSQLSLQYLINQCAHTVDINIRHTYENQHNIAYPLNWQGKLRHPEPNLNYT